MPAAAVVMKGKARPLQLIPVHGPDVDRQRLNDQVQSMAFLSCSARAWLVRIAMRADVSITISAADRACRSLKSRRPDECHKCERA